MKELIFLIFHLFNFGFCSAFNCRTKFGMSVVALFQVQFQTSKVSFEVRSSAATHQSHDDGKQQIDMNLYICTYYGIMNELASSIVYRWQASLTTCSHASD